MILKDWKTTDNLSSDHALFAPNRTVVLLNKSNELSKYKNLWPDIIGNGHGYK